MRTRDGQSHFVARIDVHFPHVLESANSGDDGDEYAGRGQSASRARGASPVVGDRRKIPPELRTERSSDALRLRYAGVTPVTGSTESDVCVPFRSSAVCGDANGRRRIRQVGGTAGGCARPMRGRAFRFHGSSRAKRRNEAIAIRTFRPVSSKVDFPAMEREILAWWQAQGILTKYLRRNERAAQRWSFLDGPITANNPMGVHHAWGRTYKDLFQRYRTMRGFRQRYQNGYDCQGLWVEVNVERDLGFRSKRDIETFGIGPFVNLRKERVLTYAAPITEQSIRLGMGMDGEDPARFRRFPLADRANRSLLGWTTTPWTLTSNVAAAVHPDLPYAIVRQGREELVLADGTLGVLQGDYAVVERVPGSQLVGLRYRGPFDDLPPQRGIEHRVIPWKDVGAEEGTGVVHIAPGCGAEDFALSREHGLPVIAPIDEFGVFTKGFDGLVGTRTDEAAAPIIEQLRATGRSYKVEPYRHRYPVCWRCDTELVFRLVDEWFIAMDPVREQLMRVTQHIRWIPAFGLDRELDWLRNMHDWMISKKRYWGLALPIYECAKCGHVDIIGSAEELRARAVEGWQDFDGHSPHRPWIDAVEIRCSKCGDVVSRIADVGNPWPDPGTVSFSTLGFRTHPEVWQQWYPADFITESFPGQYRNWFYSLLVMATVLDGREPFRTCLGYALVRDEHGEDMHKSKGNAIEFNEAADRAGVDVMRWAYCVQNPATNLNFGYGLLDDVRRRFVIPLWNVVAFFVTYANLEDFDFTSLMRTRPALATLDRWLLSRVHRLAVAVRDRMDDYDPTGASRPVEAFVDHLPNW